MQIGVAIIPQTAVIFKLTPLNQIQWIYCLAISICPIIVVELQKKLNEIRFGKVIYRKYERDLKA